MAGFLVATIPTISTFIARQGVTKAVKKYGQKAVDEARKHMKDMKTKKTPGQAKSEKGTKGQRTYRSGQRKAGATGAGMGYAAANVDLGGGKGAKSLPIADMSQSIDVRGDEGGMRYYQDGKEVRMPKK